MKIIMISIQPKWAELEMNGKKTIEVRKFYIEPPFKVVNYVTQGDSLVYSKDYEDVAWNKPYIDKENNRVWTTLHGNYLKKLCKDKIWNGKVAFEYVVNKVDTIISNYSNFYVKGEDVAYTNRIANQSCLQFPDLRDYLKGKNGYAWHISELKIYDKPKELKEFKHKCKYGVNSITGCECEDVCGVYEAGECYGGYIPVKKPPQNFVYCEVRE